MRSSSRTSLVESLLACGIAGARLDKECLRRRITIPDRLRTAMAEAIRSRNPGATAVAAMVEVGAHGPCLGDGDVPEAPMIVFINSRSGGRHGPVLKGRLQELIGKEQVFDLSMVKPFEFVHYSLTCLEMLAYLGDYCAKETREKLRVMGVAILKRSLFLLDQVAGGDGTVGWVLGSLGELYVQNREPVPPIGVIPLGTGNDLSRSFGWGGSFPFAWRSAVKCSLNKAISGPICRFDSWHILVSIPKGEVVEPPHSLRYLGEATYAQDGDIEGEVPEKASCFEGVFYNYFSIGMDAQVAYGFHHLRDEKPYLAHSPIVNKLIYTGCTCTQGWFFTPCMSDPSLRGLRNILQLSIKKFNCSEWEQIPVPPSVRALVALNLHRYGSGKNSWGNLKPEYLEKEVRKPLVYVNLTRNGHVVAALATWFRNNLFLKVLSQRGFVGAQVDDGLLEIFGLKQGWHASLVMVELISAKHIAQAEAIRLEIRGDRWGDAYMQMDGEPWKQLMSTEYSSVVEIRRMPFQSLIIRGE